jgi:predicted nucleotidyltransferase
VKNRSLKTDDDAETSYTIRGECMEPKYAERQLLKLADHERAAILLLREALGEKYGLRDFRIFGSKARGDALPDSDIDVIAEVEDIVPEELSKVYDLVFDLNLAHECFISLVLFTRREIEEGPMSESPLYRAVAREGVAP